jgi:hypothetical protein
MPSRYSSRNLQHVQQLRRHAESFAGQAQPEWEPPNRDPAILVKKKDALQKFRFWAVGEGLPEFEPGPIQATLARSASCGTPIADLEVRVSCRF